MSRWTSQLPVDVPQDATGVVVGGPRPFVTSVSYTTSDGRAVRWEARAHRKAATDRARGLTWWIGLIFAIGSTCFMLGPIPAYANAVGAQLTALTYFVGSLFFTTAAYLSFVQVGREAGFRWFGWAPHHIGYWATLIQWIGTLFFSVMTYRSMLDVPEDTVDQVIWRPDAIGSLCFLVSSAIAFAEAGHRWWSWRPDRRDWHVTALSWWGSVFFGLSAIGAYVLPSGSLLNVRLANGGTFLGAVCFLVASILMMPEGRAASSSARTTV